MVVVFIVLVWDFFDSVLEVHVLVQGELAFHGSSEGFCFSSSVWASPLTLCIVGVYLLSCLRILASFHSPGVSESSSSSLFSQSLDRCCFSCVLTSSLSLFVSLWSSVFLVLVVLLLAMFFTPMTSRSSSLILENLLWLSTRIVVVLSSIACWMASSSCLC